MTIAKRKLGVLIAMAAVILLANAATVVFWLNWIGLIPFATYLRDEYLTGTSITVIIAIMVLVPSGMACCARRCPVCDCLLSRRGKYCSECGSRVG